MISDVSKTIRRITVESIIGLAADSMANFQLINVIEREAYTTVEFELYHTMRGIDSQNVKRVRINIETIDE